MEQDNKEIFNKSIDVNLWRKVMKYLGRYWKHVMGIIIAMVIQAATDATFPLFTEYAIDNFIANEPRRSYSLCGTIVVLLPKALLYIFLYILQTGSGIW